jgi:hypothetical protein
MKIDWKHLATTPGYKSLKAAYVKDVQEAAKQKSPMRKKDEFLRQFNWIINRAKHYSYQTGKSIETILNEWEEVRQGWWFGYYQNSRQPKFHSNSIKNKGIRGVCKYYKNCCFSAPRAVQRARQRIAVEKRKQSQKKSRWSMARKEVIKKSVRRLLEGKM